MKRVILDKIIAWNKQKHHKPLILMGARQVGKTWLMNEFARIAYPDSTVSINLMKMKALKRHLDMCDLAPSSILEIIKLSLDVEITPGKTLLIIDEIQESSNCLTALKFFNEEMPDLSIIVAGSLLGLSVGRAGENRVGESQNDNPNESRGSFPVGKVQFLNVPPMSFFEFVLALGKRGLAEKISEGDPQSLGHFSEELTNLLRSYLLIGGMPEAVKAFVETRDLGVVRDVQLDILSAYDSDFVKHAPITLLPKIRLLWRSIPAQLAKENKKFIYTALKAGARAREYEAALIWLEDAGMLHQIFRVGTPRLPLKSYRDFSSFKLYAHDVGLLAALSDVPPATLLEGNALFTNFKGTLTEEYVMQELIVQGLFPCYWSNDAGNAEVEFVVQGKCDIFPIEVKAGINTQAKSLKVYRKLFNPPFVFRTSLAPAHEGDEIKDIPLYIIGYALCKMIETYNHSV